MPAPSVKLLWRRDGHTVLPDAVAIVVDVLRASSTITTALARGATEIAVTREVDHARRLASAGRHLLVGERHNQKIEGFDYSNSPADLDTLDLTGRRIAFTSTNFPHALRACTSARCTLVGAVVNVTAAATLAAELAEPHAADICIMLAGEPVQPHAFEDYYFAGLAAAVLAPRCRLDPTAEAAAAEAANLSPPQVIARSAHARELVDLDQHRDVEFALMPDRFNIVGRRVQRDPSRLRDLIVTHTSPQ